MGAIIALQLYTVRDETDFKSILRCVAEIGYTAVEFADYGNLSSQGMAASMADTGLQAIGFHVRLPVLEKDFDHEINYALDPGCTLLVIPSLEAKWRTSEGIPRLCTIWAAFAGVDPIGFMPKHPGRIVALHLKDMTPNRTFTEVGDGTLDVTGYTRTARSGGTRTFIVENDSPGIPSLTSARRSFENMRQSMEWW
jgi:sugar phosphate isomerase/epimerase